MERDGGIERGAIERGRLETTASEWVIAALSALLTIGVIGFLLYEALFVSTGPPLIVVRVDSIFRASHGWVVEFEAQNQGHEATASLVIEGSLLEDTTALEVAEATIDYLPALSTRGGGLYFDRDPRRHEVRLRVVGYARP